MTSIYDIAARVGVSGVTVSNVLSGRSQPTRSDAVERAEEIRRVARQMGYRPNAAARAARSGRFQRVGLVLPYRQASYMPCDLASGLTHALNARNYELVVSELPPADADPELLPCMLRELRVDALMALAWGIGETDERVLVEQGLPIVRVNEKTPVNAVYPDELDGARQLTEYLLAAGHRRIGYLELAQDWVLTLEPVVSNSPAACQMDRAVRTPRDVPLRSHYSSRDRQTGYAQAMLDAGLRPDVNRVGGRDPEDRQANLTALLRRPDRPTALILQDETHAITVLRTASGLGLSLPGDISVASFGWGGTWRSEMGLTCIRYGGVDLAEQTARMLFDRIARPAIDIPSRAFRGALLIDQTVRPYEEECSS